MAMDVASLSAFIRKTIDMALRESDKGRPYSDGWSEDHLWRGSSGSSGYCTAHNEGLYCCLDPDHEAYDKLLDYLTERFVRALVGSEFTPLAVDECGR